MAGLPGTQNTERRQPFFYPPPLIDAHREPVSAGSVPRVVHRGASVDVGRSGVGAVHHQQLGLQDLPRLGGHVERRGALLLQADAETESAQETARTVS